MIAVALLVAGALVFSASGRVVGGVARVGIRWIGLLYGGIQIAFGVLGLVGWVESFPVGGGAGADVSSRSLQLAVPALLLVAGSQYVWGIQIWNRPQSTWIRRFGWMFGVIGLSLTALSDVALVAAAVTTPTLVEFASTGARVESSSGPEGR